MRPPRAVRAGLRQDPLIDEILGDRLISRNLCQLAVAIHVASAVTNLQQVRVGPQAEKQGERRSVAVAVGVLLGPFHQRRVTRVHGI